jgi:hypothetical protein
MFRIALALLWCASVSSSLAAVEASAKPKPRVIESVKAGKPLPEPFLKKAKLAAKGKKLIAASGYRLVKFGPDLIGVVSDKADTNAARVAVGAILQISDGTKTTVHICSGISCKSCQFFVDTQTAEAACDGCPNSDCKSSSRTVPH